MSRLNFKNEDEETSSSELKINSNSVVDIPTELLELGENIRDMSTDQELEELGQTIREYGQLEPCIVHKNGGKYTIDMGSRRYKACVLSDIPTVKCIVQDKFKDEKERIIIQAIENEHRRNMSTREREKYISQLLEMGMTQAEIAKALHKNKGWISEALKAYSNYQKDKDIFDQIGEEISTRTMADTASLSSEELKEAVEKAKKSDNAKKTFSDSVAKIKKEKTSQDSGESGNESIEADIGFDGDPFSIEIDESGNEEKKSYTEDVKSLDIRYSVTVNDSEKEVRISSLTGFNDELDSILKEEMKKYFSGKGYAINAQQ